MALGLRVSTGRPQGMGSRLIIGCYLIVVRKLCLRVSPFWNSLNWISLKLTWVDLSVLISPNVAIVVFKYIHGNTWRNVWFLLRNMLLETFLCCWTHRSREFSKSFWILRSVVFLQCPVNTLGCFLPSGIFVGFRQDRVFPHHRCVSCSLVPL